MALIVDIILVIVLLCCVYVGWKNGFIKEDTTTLTWFEIMFEKK